MALYTDAFPGGRRQRLFGLVKEGGSHLGTGLVTMRLSPTTAIANIVYARAEANPSLPVRELMWSMPGSMLACVHMSEMTGEPR